MPGVIVVYLGLVTMFAGGVSVLKPLKFLAIDSRWQALAVMAAGLVLIVIGASLPSREIRVAAPRTQLDQFVPAYQFNEFHSVRIAAPKDKVYTALKQVTAEEILFFHTLVWLRRLGRPGPESILNPPPNTPLLEVATKTTFILLAEEPNQEIAFGTLIAAPRGWRPSGERTPEAFKALLASQQPGFVLAAMNFRLEACDAKSNQASPCTLLTTETRVYTTDAASRRAFARYWRVIYPGSSLIRRMWLRAIKKRAEAGDRGKFR
ncbi:MAG TPA: hypothetical protein VGQ61_06335 [Candidatus Angelobacter sp.]|nr:hypothetical protein [Candidatus Angelobacter sp.]